MQQQNNGIINIHGKNYQTVALRVSKFRQDYPAADGWSIITDLIKENEKVVIMKASIIIDKITVATGYAEERRDDGRVNKTSALENAETSAIGRALAAFGMAGTEYCSADELTNALRQQATTQNTTHQPPTTADYRRTETRRFEKPKEESNTITAEQKTELATLCDYLKIDNAAKKELFAKKGGYTKEAARQVIADLRRKKNSSKIIIPANVDFGDPCWVDLELNKGMLPACLSGLPVTGRYLATCEEKTYHYQHHVSHEWVQARPRALLHRWLGTPTLEFATKKYAQKLLDMFPSEKEKTEQVVN